MTEHASTETAKRRMWNVGRRATALLVSSLLVLQPIGPALAEEFDSQEELTAQAGPGMSSSSSVSWSGATTITSATTTSGQTYSSTTANQNAVLVDTSGAVTLANPTVTKSGGTDAGDSTSFYGINSAVMCKGGGTTTITGANVTTSAAGANGVFSYGGNASTNATSGDGTTVVISDSTITTTGAGSGGIMTTGYGTTKASNLTINTSGASSAAIRSDRGGGIVTVNGGTYKTTGVGSPAIYATATITATNATLTSTASQGVVNEGGNTVVLNNCTVNAGNKTMNGQDMFRNGIFLYQSMSGDASDGASVFTMSGGTLNNTYGHVFHVTNTSAAITLNDVDINNSDSSGVLLSVCDDAWSGLSNKATVNATNQTLDGNFLVGSDSTLNLNLSGTSTWNGTTSGSITSHKNSSTVSSSLGTVNVTLADNATIVLTADTTLSSLSGSGYINYNGHTLTLSGQSYSSGNIGNVVETDSTGTSSGVSYSIEASSSSSSSSDSSTQTMYRLYNPNSGEHFYTANSSERATVIAAGWVDEGVGWTAPTTSNTPVYRLYSGTDHHYTTNVSERNYLISVGWIDEGVGWYSDDSEGVPLYRQYNPNVNPHASRNNSGSHNYTTSKGESDYLVSLGWIYEGVSWYGVS